MVTEDYVSFETAKLLKEKRFDGECDLFGRTDESELIIRKAGKIAYNQGIDDECVILPTLQMAMKWLREKHKIDIAIYPYGEYTCDNYQFDVYKDMRLKISKDDGFMQYEQALEAAIKYCLENLI